MAVGLDPATGIYTYADGSTYQNPHNYGTAANPQWALTGAQVGAMLGDQGAAVNAANGWDGRSIANGGSGLQDLSGVPGGGAGSWGAGASSSTTGTHNNSYGGASGGASGGGMAGGLGGQNPYLQPMMDSITSQVTNNFNRNVMPAISSGAMASGNFGGSRQGVIEANAMNDLNQGLSGALSNLGLQDFNAMRGYDLGLRGNDLGFAGLDAQINQNNFNNRLQGANFGLGLWNQGMANNQTGINAGTNIQNTPMNYWSQFGNQYNSIGQGFGTTTGSASQQGNPLMGALGGAQLGSQIGNWWGGGGGTGMTGSNAPASSYNIGSFDYGIGGGGGGGLGLKF